MASQQTGQSTGHVEDRKIKVTIDPIGRPTVEAIGFQGDGCIDATAAIEKALGSDHVVVDRNTKPEFFQEETAGEQLAERRW